MSTTTLPYTRQSKMNVFCSHCDSAQEQSLLESNIFTPSVFLCSGCNQKTTECTIDGKQAVQKCEGDCSCEEGQTMPTFLAVESPYDESVIGYAPCTPVEEYESILESMEDAQKQWQQLSPQERADVLLAWRKEMEAVSDELHELMSAEAGKIKRHSQHELGATLHTLEYTAEKLASFEFTLKPSENQRVRFTPIGIVAAITPWNFPMASIMMKVVPAIAAGCAVICKPSEQTPLIANALMQLGIKAGLPQNLFRVVSSETPQEWGEILATHSKIRKLTFTGSTKVGKTLYRQAADTVKNISLELGGNAPFIVFSDCDMEKALGGAMGSRFYNNGQICLGSNRVFVAESIYDDFVAKFKESAQKLKMGDPQDLDTELGPLIHKGSKERIEGLIQDAVEKGATLELDGRDTGNPSMLGPTILTNVDSSMRVHNEEIFGPMACFYRFNEDSLEEIIANANDTPAGLAGYVYTENLERLDQVERAIEVGMIGLNTTDLADMNLPFGGIKESGIGREGGEDLLKEFLQEKTIVMG